MRKLSHWLEELTPSESLDVLRDLAYRHACEGGAVGLQIASLIRKGDFRALVEFELNYSDPAWTAHAVKHCRQALAFFQKLPDLEIGVDKDEVALQKFLEAEELCRQTNDLLRKKRAGLLSWPSRVEAVFHGAQRKIADVLGVKTPDVSELDLRFGPGATRGTKRSDASIRRKLAENIQCSEDLVPLAGLLLGEMPHLTSAHEDSSSLKVEMSEVTLSPGGVKESSYGPSDEIWRDPDGFSYTIRGGTTVIGNGDGIFMYSEFGSPLLEIPSDWEYVGIARELEVEQSPSVSALMVEEWVSVPVEVTPARLNFVPKSAKTHRSVCTEAGLNVMFQLALGKIMAQRLAAVGVDIRDQTLNQRRALEGSLTGALATLDLSSASDTISKEIVYELLPLQWADLLRYGRSSIVELPNGNLMSQEKFSSMGNGYTFPLETLIFWGLAAACCDRDSDVSVYGDDIVVPVDRFDLLREVLHYAGFVVNVGKSFSTGPFRESCGKDYFRGIDVRPSYFRGWVSAQRLFVLHNFYVRDLDFDSSKVVESFIHPDLKLWGPDGYGDGHLIGEHPKRVKLKYVNRGFGGYLFSSFTTKQRRDTTPIAAGDAILPVYTIYRREAGDDDINIKPEPVRAGLGSTCVPWKGSVYGFLEMRYNLAHYREPLKGSSLSIPCEGDIKALTLPGVDGYKKIDIYTLGS